MNGRNSVTAAMDPAVARWPQWSRPVNGRNRRSIYGQGYQQATAAMEPASEWPEQVLVDKTTIAMALPQWSRPVNGRNSAIGLEFRLLRLRPQWSRPVNGRNSWPR